MTKILYKFNRTSSPLPDHMSGRRLLTAAAVAALSMSFSTTSMAATNDDATKGNTSSTNTYVDSIHQWGAWGLDIEPAAGGLQAQATQPLNARATKVTLRTNSISALAPPPPAIVIMNTPVPTPLPVIPEVPPAPPVTPPIGGPADGLF